MGRVYLTRAIVEQIVGAVRWSLFLGAVALVACDLPARRAATIDPVLALRHE